jgi:hypothetical protein
MSATNQRRSNSGITGSLSSKSAKQQNIVKPTIGSSSSALLSKEEEYLKLNAELEAKTATLVYEADQVLKENEKLYSDTSLLSRINTTDYLDSVVSNYNEAKPPKSLTLLRQQKAIASAKSGIELDEFHRAIENIEKKTDTNWNNDDEIDDEHDDDEMNDHNSFLPKQASEMSSVAQIRFLKAKLRVMQEETDRLNSDLNRKDEEISKLVQRCKDLDEEKQRNSRVLNSNQTQLDKLRKQIDELTQKLTQSEIQFQNIKKESDSSKKELKKQQQDEAQAEIRVNRLLEENEKYKQQLHKIQTQSKDVNEQDKKRVEQLQIDNKRLEKQKQELMQAFKKQLKLIDILKKQKMHLEASKMLQFSEEEFLKALEWNQTTSNANYEPVQNNN